MLVRDSFFRARFRSAFVHLAESVDVFEIFSAHVEFYCLKILDFSMRTTKGYYDVCLQGFSKVR